MASQHMTLQRESKVYSQVKRSNKINKKKAEN